jgi:hypothetical protein
LAIGGSLRMVSVRPSVQNKYLNKAGSKIGTPVEDKGNNGFMGMGEEFSEAGEKKHRGDNDDHFGYPIYFNEPAAGYPKHRCHFRWLSKIKDSIDFSSLRRKYVILSITITYPGLK